ncbi:MAG: capsule assembly Wzi family protein [Smithella sp.]|nr:capsule assembly Wzi family protein [Smithella sp.]
MKRIYLSMPDKWKKDLMKIAIIIFAITFTHSQLFFAHAASSTNVSLDNDLYRDMEFWAAEGLIESQLLSIKPLTKSEAGKQIAAALDKCSAMETPSATCRNIRERYAKLFAPEIAEARNTETTANTFLKPLESASVSYRYLDGAFSIYNNEGIPYGDGHNAAIQFESNARLWKVLSFSIQPQLAYYGDAGNKNEGSEFDMRLQKGYAKLTACNLELEVGRDSLWWGPGYHGALLMSNNAQPFDLIKLSNPEPVLLPWIFSRLGLVQFNLIFSQLNDERTGSELANPFLYGLRLGIKPHPYLELGATHLVLFGGPERRDLSFEDILKTLYSNTNRNGQKTDSNQEVAVDFALTFPNIGNYIFLADGLKIYCEIGAEDTGFLPDRRAYIGGFALYKPFALERAVLRGEYANLSPNSVPDAWYDHPFYPMRYEENLFGHHAGNDSEDFFVEWSQDFEKLFYKLGFDRERNGFQTKTSTEARNQYSGEIGYRFNANSKVTLRYVYERINNFGNAANDSESNQFVGIDAMIYF